MFNLNFWEWRDRFAPFIFASGLRFGLGLGCSFCLQAHPISAQVIPDSSLPTPSRVQPEVSDPSINSTTLRIEGGTIAGSNLFHSFQEFSLLAPNTAEFFPPDGITTIFNRVTGGQLSNLDGTLRSDRPVDVYFINPAGIQFGANARLALGGSFIASTADALVWENGDRFSAIDPLAPSLLNITAPIGLQFGQSSSTSIPAPILSQGATLTVPAGQQLGLVGGELTLNNTTLTAPNGELFLGAIGAVRSSTLTDSTPQPSVTTSINPTPINSTPIASIWWLDDRPPSIFPDTFPNPSPNNVLATLDRAALNLTGTTRLSISNTTAQPGGRLLLWGSDLDLSGDTQLAAHSLASGSGGQVTIDSHNLTLRDGAHIVGLVTGTGQGSDITLRADNTIRLQGEQRLTLINQVLGRTLNPQNLDNGVYAITAGQGNTGTITIDAAQLDLDQGTGILNASFGRGNGSNIQIQTDQTLSLNQGSLILAGTLLTGTAGDVNIQADRLQIADGSSISTSTFGPGQGGDTNLEVRDIQIIGAPVAQLASTGGFSRLFLVLPTGLFSGSTGIGDTGSGSSGDINIQADRLTVQAGGLITAASTSIGSAGTVNIQAATVDVVGASTDGRLSSSILASASGTTGNAGDLRFDVGSLSVRDGGTISATTFFGSGNAGAITINARDRITVSGRRSNSLLPSGITAGSGLVGSPFQATGAGGDLQLNAPEILITDGGVISVSSVALGNAGTLRLNADRLILAQQGQLIGTTGIGAGGNLQVTANSILLRESSRIATDAQNSDGGNITINADTLVAFNNSDITANARQGRGGQVRLATQGIFGTAFRSRLTPNSDITATSNLGAEFEGIVEIQTPDLDTSSGLTRLSEQVYGAIPAWTNSCAQFANSQFILSSRHQARSESFNLSLPFHFPLQVVVPSAAALSMEHEQGVDLALESAVDHGIDRESNQLTYQTPDQGSNQQKINEATHWSQSTNGTIQLYQSAIDAPSVEPIGCRS